MDKAAKNKKILFFGFIVSVLAGSLLILSIMLINITNTAESLAKSLISRTTDKAKTELDKYFETIITSLYIGRDLCNQGVFDAINYKEIDTYILPVFKNITQLNTVVVADTLGNEYSLIRENLTWLSNRVFESQDSGMVILRYRWKGNNISKKSNFIKLLKLCDKIASMYDETVKRGPKRRREWKTLTQKLLKDVENHYGNIQLVILAKAILKNCNW